MDERRAYDFMGDNARRFMGLPIANPDPAAVGKAVIELKTIHEQVRAKQADLEKQLTSILNPTQQQIVNNLRSQAQTFTALRRLGLLGMPESSHGT